MCSQADWLEFTKPYSTAYKNAYQVYTPDFMPEFTYLGDTPMPLQIKKKSNQNTNTTG